MKDLVKKVLMLVPYDYENVGGMRFPIENYAEAIKTCYELKIIKIGYEYSKEDITKIKTTVDEQGNLYYVIVYGLNQCADVIRYFRYVFGSANMDIRKIGLLIDSEYLYASSIFEKTTWGNAKVKLKSLVRKYLYKIREKKCLNWYDDVVYVSAVDAEFVKTTYSNIKTKVHIIENGVNIPEQSNVLSRASTVVTLGFLSHMSQAVIDENVMPLLNELMPKVLELCPNVNLVIAGKGMEEKLQEIFRPYKYIKYIGQVDNLADFYNQVDVVLSYTKKKNGILNKVLEAWAYSKCVIGYDYNFAAFSKAVNGSDYIGKSQTADIALAVADVYKGSINPYEIGSNAKKLVQREYSWDEQKRKFLAVLDEGNKD